MNIDVLPLKKSVIRPNRMESTGKPAFFFEVNRRSGSAESTTLHPSKRFLQPREMYGSREDPAGGGCTI